MFGHKKPRQSRAAILRTSTRHPMLEMLRDRSLILRAVLGVVAMACLMIAVQAWKASFPFRLGDNPSYGVAARMDFRRIQQFETERARAERAAQVPYIFRNDPAPLRILPLKLRAALEEVAQAATVDDLPPETQAAFAFTPNSGANSPTSEEVDDQFASLKTAVVDTDGAGTRIDDIVVDFESFVRPLFPYGLISEEQIAAAKIRSDAAIAIVTGDNDDRWDVVALPEVTLPVLLSDTGSLGAPATWQNYPRLSVIQPQLKHWLLKQSPTTLHYDTVLTEQMKREAKAKVPPVFNVYNKGEMLVRPGEKIDPEKIELLRAEYDDVERSVPARERFIRIMTVLTMFVVLAVLNGYYLVHNEPHLIQNASRLSVYLCAIVIAVGLGRILAADPWRAEAIPLVATVMIFAIAYNPVLATLTGFTLSLILTVSTGAGLGHFAVLMSAAATAAIPLGRVSSRSKLIKVGFWCGAVYFVVSWGAGIIQTQSLATVWSDSSLLINSLKGAGWCLAAGYLVAGSLPFIESAFGVVTNISLLELSDISHPLLQELVRRAPGTYNHSIAVAAIGETAAESIGANGLLIRVGAYFHDIGKMLKPHYFIENMTDGERSRHEHLAPAMSTLIIIGHVKDGVDLAKEYNVPKAIIDFIEQHHGTTLVEYFYHAAAKLADQKTGVEESSFRYPGPKPQSREAGVMMLADAVESASRTLSDPAPMRIERLVHEITMKRLLDGQFDESSLKLSEIRVIEESLVKSLIGVYHGRIKYPSQQRTA